MNTLKDFKRFTTVGYRSSLFISFRKNGEIAFSMGAVHKLHLDYKFVILWISNDGRRVGIQFTNDKDEAGAIRIQKKRGSFSFFAGSFLKLNDIPQRRRRHSFKWHESERLVVFCPFDNISSNITELTKQRTYKFKPPIGAKK